MANKYAHLAWFLVALASHSAIRGQDGPVKDVEGASRVAKRAERLAGDGKPETALAFTAAWLQQQVASNSPAEARHQQLEQAVQDYEQVLDLEGYEAHRQTRENIYALYKQLGDRNKALEILQTTEPANERQRYEYLLHVGELDVDAKKFKEALATFRQARQVLPSDEAASWQILIYAERNRWEQGNWRAAPYHLQREVRYAQRNSGADGTEHQPLPHLTWLHARGLQEHGDEPAMVRQLYVNAAKGFLEADDLGQSARALDLSQLANAPERKEEDVLRQVLVVRSKVRSANVGKLSPEERDQWIQGQIESLSPDPEAVSPAFLRRQRAKIWSDFGNQILQLKGGNDESAKKYYLQSFNELKAAGSVTAADVRQILVNSSLKIDKEVLESRIPEMRLSPKESATPIDADRLKSLNLEQLQRSPKAVDRKKCCR